MIRKKIRSFPDGVAVIYRRGNKGEPGYRPEICMCEIGEYPYRERTVGATRFYQAMQAREKVSRVIRILAGGTTAHTEDIAELTDGRRYRIVQIQTVTDEAPPCFDLSLAEDAGEEPGV